MPSETRAVAAVAVAFFLMGLYQTVRRCLVTADNKLLEMVNKGLHRMLEEKRAELTRLTLAVRRHRDERGDDRCWLDDEELYKVLPEGYAPPARDTCVEIENCTRFIHLRHHPRTAYLSPQRRIEELEALVRSLGGTP